MLNIDFDKGYWICRIRSHHISVPSRNALGKSNRGWENLKKQPTTCEWIERRLLPNPFPKNLREFHGFLQDEFGKDNWDSGDYVLICFDGSVRWKYIGMRWKWGKMRKHYRKVRPFVRLARFYKDGDSIIFDKNFQTNARGKFYRVWTGLPHDDSESEELFGRKRLITMKDLGKH